MPRMIWSVGGEERWRAGVTDAVVAPAGACVPVQATLCRWRAALQAHGGLGAGGAAACVEKDGGGLGPELLEVDRAAPQPVAPLARPPAGHLLGHILAKPPRADAWSPRERESGTVPPC